MYSDHQIIKLFRVLTKAVIFLLERYLEEKNTSCDHEYGFPCEYDEAEALQKELQELI